MWDVERGLEAELGTATGRWVEAEREAGAGRWVEAGRAGGAGSWVDAGRWSGAAGREDAEALVEETAPFSGQFEDEWVPGRAPEVEKEWNGSLVRPYAWTGGRTSSDYDLRLETLVSLETNGVAIAMRDTGPEQRSIVELCASPRSVAEVSALLALPLGVVRVLLGDLITMGVVGMHDNATAASGPDQVLLERVLVGLRNL
ncbi:DUF742 domain-containing protein [Actinosynnema sp. NPDC023587]|uniref:DUF742 domain-containing protein n=1 Tax=Actinosynnema sp. NPDC023587 TaxID=3154695 RepID=UPI0033E17660